MKLTPLEKSHLAAIASGEPRSATTTGDFRALERLTAAKLIGPNAAGELSLTAAGKSFTRSSSNMFTKAQIAQLHRRIKAGKPWVPKIGDLVYMDTKMSIDHGWDDVCGGLAQVTKISRGMSGGDSNCVFIEVAQHNRGGNWTQFLCPDQAKLMARFGNQVAYPDPDYN